MSTLLALPVLMRKVLESIILKGLVGIEGWIAAN